MNYTLLFDNFGQGGVTAVPVAKCTGDNTPDQRRPYSAFEVLTMFYGESMELVLGNFFKMRIDALKQRKEFENAQAIRLLNYRLKMTRSKLQQPLDRTVVDFIINCSLEYDVKIVCNDVMAMREVAPDKQAVAHSTQSERSQGDAIPVEMIRKRYRHTDVLVRYILNMRPCEQTCLGPLIFLYDETAQDPWLEKFDIPTNEYLLPILRAEDYEMVAHRMIETYYPEYSSTLPGSQRPLINGDDLARRMGLKVEDVHFADPSTMGQIYYAPGEVELRDIYGRTYTQKVKPGTILVSIDHCGNNMAVRNSTICHECSHMYLDRWFFFLQMMTGKQYASHTSRKKKFEKKHTYKKNGPIDWMELQCDKLPAYLLMESENTTSFVEQQYQRRNGERTPDNVYSIVDALANRNQVSFSMAKIRLTELGYHEAEGIRCYVDQKRIPDHGCNGKWPEGATYTISAFDAAELMQTDPAFERKIASGRYCYVEGHFCLNDRRYVGQTRTGNSYLTPYARSHMDECCIAFHAFGRYKNSSYRQGYANSNKKTPVTDKYRPGYELAAEPGTAQYKKENVFFAEDSCRWGDLLYTLEPDFHKAVDQIRKLKGLTHDALAGELGVDRAAYNKYLKQASPSIEHVVGICLALKVPVYISLKLLELSGNMLQNREVHHLYREFLLQTETLTVERCEDILDDRGFEPLFKGERTKENKKNKKKSAEGFVQPTRASRSRTASVAH